MPITQPGGSDKYDDYRHLYGMNDAAFKKWRLAYAKQRAATKLATILFLGDSIPAGNSYLGVSNYWLASFPGRVRAYFAALTGVDTGTGFIRTSVAIDSAGGFSAPASGGNAITTIRTGAWTNFGGVGYYDAYASNTGGNTISFSWTGSQKLRVFTYRGIAGSYSVGNHTSDVDGTPGATISNAAPQAIIATDFTPVGSGAHTLTLTVVTGYLTVCGVELRPASDASNGVVVHNGGYPSQSTATMVGTTDAYQTLSRPQHVAVLAPDLTIIMLGTNDMGAVPVTVANYRINMQTLITAAKTTGDVLLLTPPRDNSGANADYANYLDVLYSLSDINSVPVLDLRHRFETYPDSYMDSVGHMTDLASRDTAVAIQSVLQIA